MRLEARCGRSLGRKGAVGLIVVAHESRKHCFIFMRPVEAKMKDV
jgi:hypothetical protein